MIIHNSAPYTRPVTNIDIPQRLQGRRTSDLFSGFKLTQGTLRVVLGVCMVTAGIHLVMSGYSSHLATTADELENRRHELMDQNITLRAMRASLMTPDAIQLVAGERLALQTPAAGQVFVFNKSNGRFETVQ